jgi:hypothetical protein
VEISLLFVAVFLIVSLLTFFAIFFVRRASQRARMAQKCGASWLVALRVFVAKVQKHRGLTTAYINGNHDRHGDIKALSLSLFDDINKIEGVGTWIQKNREWNSIVEHWTRLSESYKTSRDPANNITQHTRLIQNLLYLIEEMADEHDLLQIKLNEKVNIEFLWRDLLYAIEYLGQARAVGAGITAKRSCSSVERIKMKYLYQKIEENCFGVTQFLPGGVVAEREVRDMLSTIDREILSHGFTLDSSQYFDRATQTMECLYEQFDRTLLQSDLKVA